MACAICILLWPCALAVDIGAWILSTSKAQILEAIVRVARVRILLCPLCPTNTILAITVVDASLTKSLVERACRPLCNTVLELLLGKVWLVLLTWGLQWGPWGLE